MIKIFYKLSALFYKIHRYFFNKAKIMERHLLPLSEINKEKWYQDGKENTLRFNYPLTKKSIVFDVGGYEGDFASEIFSRYQCKIFVFEPVNKYVTHLNSRFRNNSEIKIIPNGLGANNEKLKIFVMDEASSYNRTASIHKKGIEEVIEIISINDFILSEKISEIDLIKINIEGAEYDLLDAIIEKGNLEKYKNLQIQFHDFYPNFQNRYQKIKEALSLTHELTYSYPFVWENWKLK